MFYFMLIALVAVVVAVSLVVLGSGSALPDAEPDRLPVDLPGERPVAPADVAALRLPVALRGYRMADVDDVLDRLGAELAERDARVAELSAQLAVVRGAPIGAPAVPEEGRREAPPWPAGGGGPAGGLSLAKQPAQPEDALLPPPYRPGGPE